MEEGQSRKVVVEIGGFGTPAYKVDEWPREVESQVPQEEKQ